MAIKTTAPVPSPNVKAASDLAALPLDQFKEAMGLEFEAEGGEAPAPTPAPEPAKEAAQLVGKQEAKKEEPAPTPAPEAAPEPEAAAEVEAAPEPEAPKPEEKKPPLTKFAVHDSQGELEVPELFFDFKANGKDYEKVPLDKVVSLAQMGVYNHEQQQKLRQEQAALSQRAGAAEQRAQQLEAAVQELEGSYAAIFSDPAYFERARSLYLEQHSPERRAARAEQQLATERARLTTEREEQQAAHFVSTVLTPAVEHLLTQHPLVSEREVIGQYTLLTAPLLERGRVPLQRLADVKSLVDTDLSQWVKSLQTERELSQKKVEAKVTAAQTQATLAKRQIARAVAPQGRAAPPRTAAPKTYKSVEDWQRDNLGGTLATQQEST